MTSLFFSPNKSNLTNPFLQFQGSQTEHRKQKKKKKKKKKEFLNISFTAKQCQKSETTPHWTSSNQCNHNETKQNQNEQHCDCDSVIGYRLGKRRSWRSHSRASDPSTSLCRLVRRRESRNLWKPRRGDRPSRQGGGPRRKSSKKEEEEEREPPPPPPRSSSLSPRLVVPPLPPLFSQNRNRQPLNLGVKRERERYWIGRFVLVWFLITYYEAKVNDGYVSD